MNGSASTDTVVINKATTTTAGVMSAADKTKLDGLSNYDDSTITQDITRVMAESSLADTAQRGQQYVFGNYSWSAVTQRFEEVICNWFE